MFSVHAATATNTIVIEKADLSPYEGEVASITFSSSTGQGGLVTYPDGRLGDEAEKYPVTIDTSWSTSTIREIAENAKHKEVLPMTECESQFVSIKRLDSNGKYSYGPLQYQSSTWNGWEKQFNFEGDPMNPEDAVKMADMALGAGLGFHWTCFGK